MLINVKDYFHHITLQFVLIIAIFDILLHYLIYRLALLLQLHFVVLIIVLFSVEALLYISQTSAKAIIYYLAIKRMIQSALQTINELIPSEYIGSNHYETGKGKLKWGGEYFHYENGVVINTAISFKPQDSPQWRIVAYHGTHWCNLEGILKEGLLPGNPTDCLTFNGNVYGNGVYCSPYQSYAKEYSRGLTKTVNGKKVRLVLGLRIKNQESITKTSDEKIWVIKNKVNVTVQDINLTYD